MHMIKFDIEVHETVSEPHAVALAAAASVKSKWKWPWRINMLAKPRRTILKKYGSTPEVAPLRIPVAKDPIMDFYCDNLSKPPIRILNVNKNLYKDRGKHFIKKMDHLIAQSWESTYNYYAKKFRDRHLKRLQRKRRRIEAKKPKGKSLEKIEAARKEHLSIMATPKPPPAPPKIPHKWKPIEDLMAGIDVLAAPKEYVIIPPRTLRVNPRALTYQITEQVLKLAQLPDRMKRHNSEPMLPGAVKRSALTATCTPRIEKLAQPSFSMREAKKQDEDKYDPFVISPNALKYKATARMLELAKPLERE